MEKVDRLTKDLVAEFQSLVNENATLRSQLNEAKWALEQLENIKRMIGGTTTAPPPQETPSKKQKRVDNWRDQHMGVVKHLNNPAGKDNMPGPGKKENTGFSMTPGDTKDAFIMQVAVVDDDQIEWYSVHAKKAQPNKVWLDFGSFVVNDMIVHQHSSSARCGLCDESITGTRAYGTPCRKHEYHPFCAAYLIANQKNLSIKEPPCIACKQ